jgi:hypothetical protein
VTVPVPSNGYRVREPGAGHPALLAGISLVVVALRLRRG